MLKIIADCNIPFVAECFGDMGRVEVLPGRQITPEVIADADILLVRSITKVNSQLLAGSPVRFVATATIGVDHIDQQYHADHDIGFASAPGSNANSVAEYVIAGMLAVGKKHKLPLQGKSIGIVGVGNVGSKVASKARALGMKVLLNDPPLERLTGDQKYRPIDELYGCDFITMHTPLTIEGQDKTHHLADKKFFESLTAKPFFINTSRGPVMQTEAVKDAIKTGKLSGAILDVWENEPVIDNELLQMVDISTPHIAGYSYDGKIAGMIMIYQAACEFFGIKQTHTADDFLPAPEVPQITIDTNQTDEQMIIHQTVQQVYVINRDDFNTREILIIPEETRGKWFDDLRKEYPRRREFQNTQIDIDDKTCKLAKKLSGIGFKV